MDSVAKILLCAGTIWFSACSMSHHYDVVIRNGTIYDGSGGMPFVGAVAIKDDKIAGVGTLGKARAALELDASGLAVAPGFANMLSWPLESLVEDRRSESATRQRVTL